ncbi:MAG: ComF family protein, partial [Thermoleophilia bacterium]
GMTPVGPHRCYRCGKPGLRHVPECRECRGRGLQFESARAAFVFDGPVRSLVHRLKYSGHRRLAEHMADLSCNRADLTEIGKEVTLTYVPLHRSKLLSRGYNQAGMYARALARRLDLPFEDLLCKQHPTPPQNRLNLDERKVNLAGSITIRKGARCGSPRVLLIDDVYTTGSTVSECAGVLKSEIGVDVHVWTFARTVKTGV